MSSFVYCKPVKLRRECVHHLIEWLSSVLGQDYSQSLSRSFTSCVPIYITLRALTVRAKVYTGVIQNLRNDLGVLGG
jgi:hypothetical protein